MSRSSAAGGRGPYAAPTSRSTTSATTPTRTAGSSMRCASEPGVVVLHDFVLHHLVAGPDDRPARRPRLPRRDGARGRRRRPPARPRRARQADPAALGEPPGRLPPRRRGARPRDRPDRPLPLRRGPGARTRRLRGARSGGSRIPPGRCPTARARRVDGRPLLGSLREREREQARSHSCSRPSRASAATARTRGCCSSVRPRRASTSTAGCSGSACPERGSSGRTTSRRSGSGR